MCVGRSAATYFARKPLKPYTALMGRPLASATERGTEKKARKRYGLAAMRWTVGVMRRQCTGSARQLRRHPVGQLPQRLAHPGGDARAVQRGNAHRDALMMRLACPPGFPHAPPPVQHA